jgi:hypothetical protein
MPGSVSVVPVGRIEQRILLIRGEKVLIDADLAEFYGVPTKRLNEQVKRNKRRFPGDFVFKLTAREKAEVVANCDHLAKLKFSKGLPNAFSEHGALMAASVLNTRRAVEMSVFIVRAFVKMRQAIAGNKELGRRLDELERRLADHDAQIIHLIQAVRQLAAPELPAERRRIGFRKGQEP